MKAKLVLELLPLLAVLAPLRECVDLTTQSRTRPPQSPTATPQPNDDEGWVYLTRGEPLELWESITWPRGSEGWRVGPVKLDPNDATKFVPDKEATPDLVFGGAMISNTGIAESAGLSSRLLFGDVDFSLQFMLAKGAESTVDIGAHMLQLVDEEPDASPPKCGMIPGNHVFNEPTWEDALPLARAYRGSGKWHTLRVEYERATFRRVFIDDVLVQKDVECLAASECLGDSVAEFPQSNLRIDMSMCHKGAVAVRTVRVRDRSENVEQSGWTRIFDGKSLDGWRISDDGKWKVESGEIVGSGAASHLFSPRGDYKNFEVRATCKISDGGNSGLYFRAKFGQGWPEGYEAQINSTHTDPVRTGSLYNLAPIKTQLVPPDTWFRYQVACSEGPDGIGTRISIRVNDILVNTFVDKDHKFASGHIALQQHNDGSVVRFKDIEVRELP